jgi:hypothetical protein
MTRRPAVTLTIVAALATAAAPAFAAPKPVTKSYTATAPVPFPGSDVAAEGCHTGQEGLQKHTHVFAIPAAGKLVVTMDGFQGDWDLALLNGKGSLIAESGALPGTTTEKATAKVKKGDKISIVACNYAGTPTAAVKYVYTPNK